MRLGSTKGVLSNVMKAFRQLNPGNVKKQSERTVKVALVGSEAAIKEAAGFLVGSEPEAYDRAADALLLLPTPLPDGAIEFIRKCDVVLRSSDAGEELPGVDPRRLFTFTPGQDMSPVTKNILQTDDLDYARLPLARTLPGFRPEVSQGIIQTVSVENSVFVVSTSLGNVIPNPLQPLTSVAASMGDMVVLTANQIRMLFMLAAAHGRSLGFKEQYPEVLSIVGAAFGWRSIARELVGAIPMGGGVIPKGAIAFAGTWAIGDGIAFYYTTGRKLTSREVRERFDAALERGSTVAEQVLCRIREAVARFGPAVEVKPEALETPKE